MSRGFSALEWEIAEQAIEEVRARAIRENRRYSRDELAERIGELKLESRSAAKWRKRAKAAEAELARRAASTPKEEEAK